jgi:hypothetical protein
VPTFLCSPKAVIHCPARSPILPAAVGDIDVRIMTERSHVVDVDAWRPATSQRVASDRELTE